MAVCDRCRDTSRAATPRASSLFPPALRERCAHAGLAGLLALGLVLVLVLPGVHAGPGDHTEPDEAGYGDHPANPKVLDEGAACFADAAERPGTTCAVLYGHVFDFISAIPFNVQRPPVGVPDLSVGMSGFPTVESQPGMNDNEFIMQSSPGFVEYYDDRTVRPFIHPEKSIAYPVETDDTVPLRGYFWMSADMDEYSPLGIDKAGDTDPHVGVAPCLGVRMAVATTHAFGAGDIIAEGTTLVTVVSHGQGEKVRNGTGTAHACAPTGEAEIMEPGVATEIPIDLGVARADLPKHGGFHVEVEWWQYAPGDPKQQDKVATPWINVHTGHEYPNRIVVPYTNGIDMQSLEVIAFDGEIWFRPALLTPWGSYDVDPTNISVVVKDAQGTVVADNLAGLGTFGDLRMTAYDVTHGGHYDPVVGLVPWDAGAEGLPAGTYTATVTAWNWQHTASVASKVVLELAADGTLLRGSAGADDPGPTTTKVHIDATPTDPEEERAPAPGSLPVLVGVLLASFVARRTRALGRGGR